MADGPSAEEASAVDVRILSKERHKRQDASSSSSLLANAAASFFRRGQDVLGRRNVVHGNSTTGALDDNDDDNDDDEDDDDDDDDDEDDYNQVDTRPRRYHHHHYRYQQQQQQQQQKQHERIANEGAVGVGIGNHFNSGAGGGEGGGGGGGVVGGNCASSMIRGKEHSKVLLYDEEDYYEEEDEDDEEDDDEEGEDGDEEDEEEEDDYVKQKPVKKRRVRLGLKKSTEGIVTSVSSVGNNNNRNSNASVGGHVANGSASALLVTTMLGNTRSRLLPDVVDVAVNPSESAGTKKIKSNLKGRSDGEENNDNKKKEDQQQQQQQQQQLQLQPLQQQQQQLEDKKKRNEDKDRRGDDTTNDPPPLNTITVSISPASPSSTTVTTSGIANGVVANTGNSSSSSSSNSSTSTSSTSTSTTGSGSSVAGGASNVKSSSSCAGSLSNDSPFKGQVRMAEETLVGPCGKKRCADRYDSSESSDSGVAVSCGECSSSGTSDITEPGSPCSTSSDEGVGALRGASASPLPSLPKLAPSSQLGTRPQWPWTPLLAATACSTYKKHKGEPEAGTLPRSGAADPTSRGSSKANGTVNKPVGVIHHHESSSQGKITEYFKSQIKPPQSKLKKTSETMSVLVAKSSTEFRRPPTVQRNKGGLAKYLGTTSPRTTQTSNDWEIRSVNMSSSSPPPPPIKKTPPVIVPRTNAKIDKKLTKPLPSLPISNDVLKNIPPCKISSLRLTSEASPSSMKPCSPPTTPIANPPTNDYKGCIITSKPHVNENNNLTNECPTLIGFLRSQNSQGPLSRLSSVVDEKSETQTLQVDEEDVEEEEDDSRSSESKTALSPILSAPTTIRFPARAPEKDRSSQHADSGICRWDKCEASFESSTGLLEHLQVAHINTQTGGDNFVCHWLGCKVQGRTSCSRRWLERHVLSHGGNKPFRCIVDGCGSRFSSQTTLERHVNGHFNQPETSNSSGRRSCENGGKLVRRNGKRLRYRRQPWSARLFDYFDSGVMEGLQHRLFELAKSRTQGRLAETPGDSMALTSQVLARRVEMDGKVKVLLRWYPQDIEPDEWVLESEVQSTKHVGIRKIAGKYPEEVSLALYPAMHGGVPPITRVKQRRKPVKDS